MNRTSERKSARALIREVHETACRLRDCAGAGGHEADRLVDVLLSDLPRRIRRLGVGCPDAWREWVKQVLTFDPRQQPFGRALRFRLWRWRLIRLPRLVECLAYGLGVMAVFRRLNRNAKRVLTFHNVLPDGLRTGDMGNYVTLPASTFENLICRLKRRYRFTTDFADASSLTVTFDDGYRCQFETAGEILERLDVPAVVFASENAFAADTPQKSLAVDRLLFWASYAPQSALSSFAGGPVGSRAAFWNDVLWPAFLADGEKRGESVFARADALWPFGRVLEGLNPEMVRLRLTGPDVSRVARLRERGWRIGWHTYTHFPLAYLSDAAALEELTPPEKAYLDLPMSYPYGTIESVSERDEKTACRLGFHGGCSNLSCANSREGDWFCLRYTLTGDRIEDEAQLSGFRYFMETGHLLRRNNSSETRGKESCE